MKIQPPVSSAQTACRTKESGASTAAGAAAIEINMVRRSVVTMICRSLRRRAEKRKHASLGHSSEPKATPSRVGLTTSNGQHLEVPLNSRNRRNNSQRSVSYGNGVSKSVDAHTDAHEPRCAVESATLEKYPRPFSNATCLGVHPVHSARPQGQELQSDLAAPEKKADAAGAPWTPGRLPTWTPE